MLPNPHPMSHVHLEIEKAIWKKLQEMYPNYGEVSQVVRKLLAEHVIGNSKRI
jgi:hypothetical protein